MGTLKKWKNLSKLGSQPPLKSAYPGSCRPKKLFLGRFFLENHFFDPFRPNEDPQVLYMAGKLWISSLWWYKEKNIFLHPVERMIFYDGPHRYFPLYWEAVIISKYLMFVLRPVFNSSPQFYSHLSCSLLRLKLILLQIIHLQLTIFNSYPNIYQKWNWKEDDLQISYLK